jgi:protein-tyrosine phosphatase
LAEGIARKALSEDNPFKISSAGSSAQEGLPASSLAAKVAEARSLNLSKHKAKLLSKTMVEEADLIVTMGANHRHSVGAIAPSALQYTYLLTDFCDDEEGDVADPIGWGIEGYERTYAVIEKCVKAMKEKLRSFDGWKAD